MSDQQAIERCLVEQREALALMAIDERAARLWLNDWCAEEVLVRLEGEHDDSEGLRPLP